MSFSRYIYGDFMSISMALSSHQWHQWAYDRLTTGISGPFRGSVIINSWGWDHAMTPFFLSSDPGRIPQIGPHWSNTKPWTKVFPLDYRLQPSPLRLLTGCTWMTWRIADQLVCFKRILIYSDLKYDPPRRPRKMRIIDPRRSMLPCIRRQTGKHFLPTDVWSNMV